MEQDGTVALRDLDGTDHAAVRRILEASEYTYSRFAPEDLPELLSTLPATGAFSHPPGTLGRMTGGSLRAFLLINWLVPPSAWIGGFGVTWSEGRHFGDYLDLLLPRVGQQVYEEGARTLYYSGNDYDGDWLRSHLQEQGFRLVALLRSYDKDDSRIPTEGNQRVRVRPFVPADVEGVLAVEDAAFAQLWRHSAANFLAIGQSHPYFVVAEDETGIVGYQFSATDATTGYLIRIAVHPRAEGQGVGARLMAEAVRFFHRSGVSKIVLNTDETNTRAHNLYERFGFHQVFPHGFVLGWDL